MVSKLLKENRTAIKSAVVMSLYESISQEGEESVLGVLRTLESEFLEYRSSESVGSLITLRVKALLWMEWVTTGYAVHVM